MASMGDQDQERRFTEAEVKAAFWKCFHAAGELWFPYAGVFKDRDEGEKEAEAATMRSWDEFREELGIDRAGEAVDYDAVVNRALIAAAPEMEALLRKYQWSDTAPDTAGCGPICPECQFPGDVDAPVHADNCEIGNVLARIDAARKAT